MSPKKYTQIDKWINENLTSIHRKRIQEASVKDIYTVVATILDDIFNEHWNHRVIACLKARLLRMNEGFRRKLNKISVKSKRRVTERNKMLVESKTRIEEQNKISVESKTRIEEQNKISVES